ncbi:hypothetical protein ACFY19_07465 [Streptosporangium saharense]|uniref:hypothetical protein n=1 Tax=Streptosporangium saharense TaxID=1706840 RepID=UPI00369CEDA4
MPRMSRLLAVPSSLVLLVALFVSVPASAAVLDVTCVPPSSDLVTYDPALTVTPRNVAITATTTYGPCVSAGVPGLTSGSRTFQGTGSRSCLSLLSTGTETFTITWNTGQTSTVSVSKIVNVVGAALVVTFTGTVTSGLFAGDAVLQTVTGPSAGITLCTLGLGTVSSISSLVTLEITSV